MGSLQDKKCKPCEGGVSPLTLDQAAELLNDLKEWKLVDNGRMIEKTFKFPNYFRTMSFVNAIAWIANKENHHPTLKVDYNQCIVQFTTHAIKGLSENDFICAAKIDGL